MPTDTDILDVNRGREHWRIVAMREGAKLLTRPSQQTTWLALLLRMHDDGWCIPTARWLSDHTGLDVNTVRKAVRELDELDLIDRTPRFTKRGGSTSNRITLSGRLHTLARAGTADRKTIEHELGLIAEREIWE